MRWEIWKPWRRELLKVAEVSKGAVLTLLALLFHFGRLLGFLNFFSVGLDSSLFISLSDQVSRGGKSCDSPRSKAFDTEVLVALRGLSGEQGSSFVYLDSGH